MKCKIRQVLPLFIALCGTVAHAAPTPLSLAQLDQINAGFVEVEIQAFADAEGEGSFTETLTDVDINEELSECGAYYITTVTGTGYAYATGETAFTSLGSSLNTDETVLDFSHQTTSASSTLVQNDSLSKTMGQLSGVSSRSTGAEQSTSHGRLYSEHLSTITVTAVTRRPVKP